jgi:hypothetical protein
MSDAWRRKSYYRPRVLVQTDAVLESTFPDAVVCLTGGQVNLLRALLEYADRRSTFVSEYQTDGYLAPTEEEWEQLTDVVAQLEEAMSGCEDITDLLSDILEQAQCACAQLKELPRTAWPSGGVHDGQADYDSYQSEVERETGDPPGELADWGAWDDYKCIAAQIVVDDVTSRASLLANWYSAGAIVTFELFQGLILGTSLAPPVAMVLIVVEAVAVAGTAAAVTACQNWISNHKQDIVCAIHNGTTLEEAKGYLQDLLDAEWDIVMGKAFFWGILNDKQLSHIFDADLPTYAARSSNYSSTYCIPCIYTQYLGEFLQEFPPCPGLATLVGATCDGSGYPQFYVAGNEVWSQWIYVLAGSYQVDVTLDMYSHTPGGWTCGNWRIYSYDLDQTGETYETGHDISVGVQDAWNEVHYNGYGFTLESDSLLRIRVVGTDGQGGYVKKIRKFEIVDHV